MKRRLVKTTVAKDLPMPVFVEDKVATVRPHGGKGLKRDLDPALIAAMYADYQRLGSLEKVGDVWGRSRQSIFELFKRRGLKLRMRKRLPVVVEYKGRKFTEQKTCGRHRYLRDTTKGRKAGDRTIYLHHLIWEEVNGPIPEGHKLAFRDGDHRNCSIENLELLTNSEQVRRYANKGENQHTKARAARLALSIDRWIIKQAAIYGRSFRVSPEDLEQVGRVEALRTARTYREDGGASFLTYASRGVKNYMRRAAQKASAPVKISEDRFWSEGISSVSMDAPVGDEGEGATFGELFASEDECVRSEADQAERASELRRRIAMLPKRERDIILRRFFGEETLSEIADDYGLSRERIRQIERDALKALRRSAIIRRLVA